MRRVSCPGGALVVVLVSATSARADDAETAAQAAHARPVAGEPAEVTVRGSTEPDTFTSTKAASVVSSRQVREASPGSLADALRGRAGVSVQQTTPGQGSLYVRGLAGRELVYLVDGVRLNTAIFRSPNNAGLSLVDPYAFEALEVFRGPSAVLHGSDALGGVVVLNSALPPYSLAPTSRLDATQAVSSNPLGSVSRVAVRHQAPEWTAQAGLTYARAGDVTPGAGLRSPDPSAYAGLTRDAGGLYAPPVVDAQRGTGFERISADAVVRRKLSGRTEAILRGQLSDRPSLIRYDEITPRFRADGKPARAESALGPLARTMTSITLSHRLSHPWVRELLLTAAWQRMAERQYRRNLDEECVTGGPAGDCTTRLRLTPAGRATDERTRSDALSARGEVRLYDDAGSRGGIVGVEAIHDIITSKADQIAASGITRGDARYPSGSTMTQAGIFGQLEARFGDVRAHVGARGSLFALDIPGRPGVDPTLGGRALSRTVGDVGLGAGVGWQVAEGVRWLANVGRGVRAPNVEDYAGAGTRAGGRFQVPNPSLSPEHVHSVDTGIKVKTSLLRAETFVFFMRMDDAVGIAGTEVGGQARAADGSRYVRSTNIARLDLTGLESEVRVGPERAGGVFGRSLLVHPSETVQPGVTATERVAVTPQWVLGGWLRPTPRLFLEVFVHARAAMRRQKLDDNRVPLAGTSAFATVHARAAYRVNDSVDARLALDNLTDTLALEYGSGYALAGFSMTAGLEGRWSP